jgi:glycosyltransferase involved in cell wall biosynthesis
MAAEKARVAFFLATSGHSGVDRAMGHLIPELAGRGYPVDLLHVREHGPYFKPEPPGVRIVDLGTKHTYSSLPALIRYLREYQPEVMLSDKDRVNRTALLAHWLAKVPTRLILRSGTTISIDLQSRGAIDRWLQRFSMGRLYQRAYAVAVPSKGAADDMSQYTGLDRNHIQPVNSPIVPDQLLTEKLAKPDHPWFDGDLPLIISVGELCARKDFETLLKAFALLRRERPCRLMILGRGKRRESLLRLAEELGVSEDFELPGFVDSPYAYLAHARLFAFTSRWEGLPFAPVEALAVGTPVVSTDCPSGPDEILGGGKYGPLVAVGDIESLARNMGQVLDHPLPPEILKQAAKPFTVSASADAYLQLMGLRP